jgi:putative redox protein
MNQASIKWVQGLQFVGRADSGHAVVMDAARDMGGADSAARPVELLLIALGGCTGIDVLSILRKMRLKIRSFEIQIRGERVEEEPKSSGKSGSSTRYAAMCRRNRSRGQ